MNGENNNFNNDELKKENETVEENSINYSAVSGTKEYIYGNKEDSAPKIEDMQESTVNEEPKATTHVEYTVHEEEKPKKHKRRILPSIALILVVSLVSGAAGGFLTSYYYHNMTNTNDANVTDRQNIAINLSNNTYFAAAVNEKNKDSVVGITTTTIQTYNSFWGGTQQQEAQSIGSGVIVDTNGLILTNSHVIGDGQAKEIIVSLTDGSNEKAEVLWYDYNLDLAVIKINRTGLSAAELGDSDSLLVGEPVVAIGNPMSLDLNGTLTTGVISGLNRSITIENVTIKPLIQTDASINPGNSGGPLFNAEGKVIGINTAKMSTAEGLGFSIPINVIEPILSQITNEGTVTSVYVGISGASVEDYEQKLGIDLTAESGVIIIEIIKDGPVYKAGFKSGDIITAIDGNKVEDMQDLRRALYQYKVGDKAKITYIRDGNEQTTEITLEAKPKDL